MSLRVLCYWLQIFNMMWFVPNTNQNMSFNSGLIPPSLQLWLYPQFLFMIFHTEQMYKNNCILQFKCGIFYSKCPQKKTWSSVSNSNLNKFFALGSLESLKLILSLQRSFSLKFILGQKKFWVWKNFGSQKNVAPKENFGSGKILVRKNFWIQKKI